MEDLLLKVKRKTTSIKEIWESFRKGTLTLFNELVLQGSCLTLRKANAGKLLFIELLDGSTVKTLQCVINIQEKVDLFLQLCSRGAIVELKGHIQVSPAKGQPIELCVTDYKCIGSIKDHDKYFMGQRGFISRDILRTVPHQRYHTPLFLALQIIKQTSLRSLHQAFEKLEFGQVQSTSITTNECEKGAAPFTITTLKPPFSDWTKDFFKQRCFLTVSSQLHLEATVLGTKRDSYCMTTAFRAESSTGSLHLAEFLMPEWELLGDMDRCIATTEYLLKYIFGKVLEECFAELDYLETYRKRDDKAWFDRELLQIKKRKLSKKDTFELKKLLESKYEKRMPSIIDRLITYRDLPFIITTHEKCVKKLLDDMKEGLIQFQDAPAFDKDLSKEHELYITDCYQCPMFVLNYPKCVKAFYMPVVPTEGHMEYGIERVKCFDLLFPHIGEIAGGSQRIDKEDELLGRMNELGMSSDGMDWYIDLRRDASIPHSGAGLGFARLMMIISGIYNIKDMQEFPRAFDTTCFA